MMHVDAEMEWCAEAYMDTDYSLIQQQTYEAAVRDYAIYRMLGQTNNSSSEELDVLEAGGEEK